MESHSQAAFCFEEDCCFLVDSYASQDALSGVSGTSAKGQTRKYARPDRHVRSALGSGHRQATRQGPFRATSKHSWRSMPMSASHPGGNVMAPDYRRQLGPKRSLQLLAPPARVAEQ